MEHTQLQRHASFNSQPRPFIYRSAHQDHALPHPLRRAGEITAAPATPQPQFARPAAQAVLLQFRIAVKTD
jgi:hypothetical protein